MESETPARKPPQEVALSAYGMCVIRYPGTHPCEIAAFMRCMLIEALEQRGPDGIPGSIPYWEKYLRDFVMPDDMMFGSFELKWPRVAQQLSRDERKRWEVCFEELDRRVAIDSVKFEEWKKVAR